MTNNTLGNKVVETVSSTCKIITSSGVGLLVGGITSFAVVSTLGEISTNEFFSFVRNKKSSCFL